MTSLSHEMRGTSLGQGWDKGQNGTRKVFKKIVKKSMKIEPKCLILSHLRFSRGCEKGVKKCQWTVVLSEPPASAGGQFLNIRRQILTVSYPRILRLSAAKAPAETGTKLLRSSSATAVSSLAL